MIKSSFVKKLFSFIIAILPVLNIYRIGSLSFGFGDLSLLLIFGWCVVNNSNKLKFHKFGFISFFTVFFVISFLSALLRTQNNFDGCFTQWIKIIIYYYVIECACNDRNFDFVFMQKCNVYVGMLVTFVLFFQVFSSYMLNRSVTFFIPGLPLYYGTSSAEVSSLYDRILGNHTWQLGSDIWRPNSIFAEPAYYAEYVLLSLVVSLYCKENVLSIRQKTIFSLLFSVGILFSYSAIGIFTVFMVWGVFLIKKLKRRMNAKNIIMIFLVIIVGIYFVLRFDFVDKALDRLNTTSLNIGTTGTLRLLQGFAIFSKLTPLEKFIGVGFGNLRGYLIENSITTIYLREVGNQFMNGFSTVLVSGGVLGFCIYLAIWIRMGIRHKDPVSRGAFFVVSVLFCTENLFYLGTSVMYLVFVCIENEDRRNYGVGAS